MTYTPEKPAPAAGRSPGRYLAPALWPLAILAVIHRCIIRPSGGDTTDDFSTVFTAIWRFIDGERVYEQDYASIVPHYLYSPGGTLALTPLLGWSDDIDTVRWGFIAMQAAAIIGAIVLLLRWVGVPWRHWLYPGAIAAAFVTETVSNTVAFTNVNGMILLAEVAFLVLLHRRRQLWAGLIIGLAITVKPIVAPLLFLPFVRRQFGAVGAGIAVPIVFNIAAWPLMTAPKEYLTLTVPYLGVIRDYANVSLSGQFEYFGVPGTRTLIWQALVALAVIVGLVLLLRWVDRDEIFWLSTTAALLMTGVFLLGSLGQMYYSMLLFPLFATLARPLAGARDGWGEPARSVLHSVPVAAGLALCLWFTSFQTEAFATGSWWFDVGRGTVGWILIVFGLVGCLVKWTVEEAARGVPLHPALPGVRSAP
ncbi:glycosyltransferase family 87 protein [Corynebacterium sp. 335C]